MSTMTATDAKNRFGELFEQARKEPVHIQSHGRDVAVVLSPEQYAALVKGASDMSSEVASLLEQSIAKRGSLYEALAK